MPRLQQIDVSLEEAAYDLGASRLRTFRSITLPLILPAVVSAFLIAFTTSFDEYAVASFVVGSRVTFPIYLYSALRFPSQLPQVIAVAVVVITISLTVVVAAEIGRRVAERRLGAARAAGASRVGEHGGVLGLPGEGDGRAGAELRRAARRRGGGRRRGRPRVSTWNCVYMPRIDDLGDRPLEPRAAVGAGAAGRPDLHALGPDRDAERRRRRRRPAPTGTTTRSPSPSRMTA